MLDLLITLDNQGLLLFAMGLFGLCFGSFANVLIHRLPLMLQASWRSECRLLLELPPPADKSETTFTLSKPASHCPSCNTPIKAWQNIPVLSWLLLRGKCNNCKAPISIRYPMVEALTGLGFVTSFALYSPSYHALLLAAMCFVLISLFFIDLDTQLLPDSLTLGLLWLGITVHLMADTPVSIEDSLWGAILGYSVFWSIATLFKVLRGKEGMGAGDFKLLAALGACLGWQMLPQIILISAVAGTLIAVSVPYFRKGNPMPFGPWLALGGIVAAFWGSEINHWYLSML